MAAKVKLMASVPTTRANGLTIHCSDAYLDTIDAVNGRYRDPTPRFNRPQVNAPRPRASRPGITNACAGMVQAFTYSYGPPGNSVIVLCSDDWDPVEESKSALRTLQLLTATVDSGETKTFGVKDLTLD